MVLQWKFPKQKQVLLRIEAVFIGIITLLVFVFSYYQLNHQVLFALLLALIFLMAYVLISYLNQAAHGHEEHYRLTTQHIEITSKSRGEASKQKVPLKHIIRHKIDRFFLGGYILTKQGKKHLIFFNTSREANQFAQTMKKRIGRRAF